MRFAISLSWVSIPSAFPCAAVIVLSINGTLRTKHVLFFLFFLFLFLFQYSNHVISWSSASKEKTTEVSAGFFAVSPSLSGYFMLFVSMVSKYLWPQTLKESSLSKNGWCFLSYSLHNSCSRLFFKIESRMWFKHKGTSDCNPLLSSSSACCL